VLGTRAIFDPCREYQLPRGVCAKVRFCGYIRRLAGTRGRDEIRRELGIGAAGRLVLVTTGGGQDGARILDAYTAALPIVHASPDVCSLIVTGPELDPAERRRIEHSVGAHPQAHVREFTDDMMSYMAAADAVVCMGGYNTICEVASVDTPAVVVPRVRPVEEQLIRAERLARRGAVAVVHPDEMTPALMGVAVLKALNSERSDRRMLLDLGALPRIEQYIAALQRANRNTGFGSGAEIPYGAFTPAMPLHRDVI
jgi:predicted glycosyltransferase